jgi:hypothetical protein
MDLSYCTVAMFQENQVRVEKTEHLHEFAKSELSNNILRS